MRITIEPNGRIVVDYNDTTPAQYPGIFPAWPWPYDGTAAPNPFPQTWITCGVTP
jgi:hypothetical protein